MGYSAARPERGPDAPASAAAAAPALAPSWRRLRPMATLAAVIFLAAALYVARPILAPIAVATLLAFLLSPLVGALERHLGRVAAIVLVMALAFSTIGVVGWVLSQQITNLAEELPRYRANISQRISDIRGATRGGALEKLQTTAKSVINEVQQEAGTRKAAAQPVIVREDQRSATLWQLPSTVAPLIELLVTIGLVIALVGFM